MMGGRKELDTETRRVFTRLMAQGVTLGFGNVMERMRGKSEQDGPDEWTTINPDEWEKKMAEQAEEAEKAAEATAPASEDAPGI